MDLPDFDPFARCDCDAVRSWAYLAPHDRTCPMYPPFNRTAFDRLATWSVQGNYCLIDRNVRRGRQHNAIYVAAFAVLLGLHWYLARFVPDGWPLVPYTAQSVLIGAALVNGWTKPVWVKNAYLEGMRDVQNVLRERHDNHDWP